jgi:hypothetical protein
MRKTWKRALWLLSLGFAVGVCTWAVTKLPEMGHVVPTDSPPVIRVHRARPLADVPRQSCLDLSMIQRGVLPRGEGLEPPNASLLARAPTKSGRQLLEFIVIRKE